MTTYTKWLSAKPVSGSDRALTDAEQMLFDRWYREDARAAREWAERIVGVDRAHDVVHGAITREMHKIVAGRVPSPTDYDAFRQSMQSLVQSLALNMVGCKREKQPTDASRANTKLSIPARKVPERSLGRDFASYEDLAEGSGAGIDDLMLRSSAYRDPWAVKEDPAMMAQDLKFLLEAAFVDLPVMQASVLFCWMKNPSREQVSVELSIAPKTFDTHFARAKPSARRILLANDCMTPDDPKDRLGPWHLSPWGEVFIDMELDRQDRERTKRFVPRPAVEKRKAA